MAASKQAKQASKHAHARAQCSPASVGLAQARPNIYSCNEYLVVKLKFGLMTSAVACWVASVRELSWLHGCVKVSENKWWGRGSGYILLIIVGSEIPEVYFGL